MGGHWKPIWVCPMRLEHPADRSSDRPAQALKAGIETMSNEAEMPRRLRTMPGVGPTMALAVETFEPPLDRFRRGRELAAWPGFVPKQHSKGWQSQRMAVRSVGRPSTTGQRGIRRLPITGAMALVRGATRRGSPKGSRLARLLERKPLWVVAVALANRASRPRRSSRRRCPGSADAWATGQGSIASGSRACGTAPAARLTAQPGRRRDRGAFHLRQGGLRPSSLSPNHRRLSRPGSSYRPTSFSRGP